MEKNLASSGTFHLSDSFTSLLDFTVINRDILKPGQLINIFMQQSGAAIW